jgi:hypothetical protein
MKIAGKGNDASAEAELFEVFGVMKDHNAKKEVIFVGFFCLESRTYFVNKNQFKRESINP